MSQDSVYSVLPPPLGNSISKVKQDVKRISDSAKLKYFDKEGDSPSKHHSDDRRKNSNERRNTAGTTAKPQPDDNGSDKGIDLFA